MRVFTEFGGRKASGNPDLEALVESQGGRMFTSFVGGGDDEIIDYLVNGHKKGKQIVIDGHSRGGTAAVRIVNKLQISVNTAFSVDTRCLAYFIISLPNFQYLQIFF